MRHVIGFALAVALAADRDLPEPEPGPAGKRPVQRVIQERVPAYAANCSRSVDPASATVSALGEIACVTRSK
jgi:hypothetical protein